jgi:two-component system nitrogen regulation sensor histidine kinase NtrY
MIFKSWIFATTLGVFMWGLSRGVLVLLKYHRRHLPKNPQGFRVKVAGIFSLFVMLPCVIVAALAVLFLELGLQSWFQDRVKVALEESYDVAQAYLQEHTKVIEHTVMRMAYGLDHFLENLSENKKFFISNPESFFSFYKKDLNEYLNVHENFKSVREAIIFTVAPDSDASSFNSPYAVTHIASQSEFSLSLGIKSIKKQQIQEAKEKGISMFFNDQADQVFAIVPVFHPLEAYLLISRDIDSQILKKIHLTSEAVEAYDDVLDRQKELMTGFAILFGIVSLMLLLLAIGLGLKFSRQIMGPVEHLIESATQIKHGHMVPVAYSSKTLKELRTLMNTFNAMVQEMSRQKEVLMQMNKNLNERTHFIRGVLDGVSSGVISLTSEKKVLLSNKRAQDLLGQRTSLEGRHLKSFFEECEPLFHKASENIGQLMSHQLSISRLGRIQTLRVHMRSYSPSEGVIFTFEDITELIEAQKKSAWEDVARRIAHEVKNPLTPILLSAERLRRRYLPSLQDHPEIFKDCIETIIRQVTHIGKLVSEFSTFARMPLAHSKIVQFDTIIQQSIALQKQAYPHILFTYKGEPTQVECDPQQIEQVFINIIKNAVESIQQKKMDNGSIHITLKNDEDKVHLLVTDNGIGLTDLTLLEPYTTTKPGGEGLGLAIIRKIIQDHKGTFTLTPVKNNQGARVTVTLWKKLPSIH